MSPAGHRLTILSLLLFLLFLSLYPPIPPSTPCAPLKPMVSLHDLVAIWRQEKPLCEVGDTLHTLYQIEEEEAGHLVIPKPLQELLHQWVGPELDVARQQIIQVTDLLSGESTHYNPLRAQRPRPGGGSEGRSWAVSQVERSAAQCHFCRPQNFTAEEVWGRISLPHCSSAGNVFRVAATSGLILAKTHSVLEMNTTFH